MKTSGGGSPPVDSLVDLIGGVRGVHPKDSNIAKVSDADIDAFVKLLRAEDSATFDRLGRIDKEKGYRTVLKAMLEGRVPAGQQQPFADTGEFGFPEKMQAARSLTRTLAYWRERIKYAQLANEFDLLFQSGALEQADADRLQDLRQRNPRLVGPGWDRHWNTLFAEWEEKRTKLSGLLLEAAELYDSGQTGGDVFPLPTLENAKRRAGVEGLAAAKYSGWGGAETLRAIGRVIDETPVEVLFPAARPRPLGWAPGQVGKHGGASSPEGALNGMVVREIAHRVPANCAEWKGFTAISRLAKFLGLEKCTPEYVRSSLSGGRT